jgi:predicted HicB family RNase H-like nuclease
MHSTKELRSRPRYEDALNVRLPRKLNEAIDVAARAKFLSTSAYVRLALLSALKADGAMSSPVAVAAQGTCRADRH